jgi:hypothetical protein
MIHDRRQFAIGLALMAVFLAGLAVVFRPMFDGGRNLLDYLDGVFNATSKASAYYVPAAREQARALGTAPVEVTVSLQGAQARRAERLLAAAGATVRADGGKLSVSGDLGRILGEALADADAMFANDGARLSAKYGGDDGRRVLLAWHGVLERAGKELTRQGRFREAAAVRAATTKGIEPAYNYYGVTAVAMKDMIWIAVAALAGYVVYTVWYGYAILFLFEGWGLKLDHG